MLTIIRSVHKYRNDQYCPIILRRVKIVPGRELCLCPKKLEIICGQCKVVSIEGGHCCHEPSWSTPCPLFIQRNDHLPYHYVLHRQQCSRPASQAASSYNHAVPLTNKLFGLAHMLPPFRRREHMLRMLLWILSFLGVLRIAVQLPARCCNGCKYLYQGLSLVMYGYVIVVGETPIVHYIVSALSQQEACEFIMKEATIYRINIFKEAKLPLRRTTITTVISYKNSVSYPIRFKIIQ